MSSGLPFFPLGVYGSNPETIFWPTISKYVRNVIICIFFLLPDSNPWILRMNISTMGATAPENCFHVGVDSYETTFKGVFGRLWREGQFLDVTLVCYNGKERHPEDQQVLAMDPARGVKVLDAGQGGQKFPYNEIPEHSVVKAHRVS